MNWEKRYRISLVTSKVYEECSGSEDEALTTKPIAPAVKMEPVKVEAPKRPPSPAKNKQSSITKFFTRKWNGWIAVRLKVR